MAAHRAPARLPEVRERDTCRLRDAAAFERGSSRRGARLEVAAPLFNNLEGKAFVDLMRVRGCLG